MFPERTGLRADRSQTGVPGNSTELLMSSLSVPSDFRPVNENLPPVWLLSALSPVTLRKKSPSPARRLPAFSGEGTGRSTSRHRRIGLAGGWGMDRMRGWVECGAG